MNKYFFSKVAIVTTKSSWFVPYAEAFACKLRQAGVDAVVFNKYEDIDNFAEVVFLLSYFSLVPPVALKKHKYNFVVHESALPKGKGWAPLFWQILEGKNEVPIVLFEATEELDAGDIYLERVISLNGSELHDEIRSVQADATIKLCDSLLLDFPRLQPKKQQGEASFYARRTPASSELDMTVSLEGLFNQLRIASNSDYPAFFSYKGCRYELTIHKK